MRKKRRQASRPAVILVSGFDPFGAHKVNPSSLVALALEGTMIRGAVVRAVVLPTSFKRAYPTLKRAIRAHRPCLVVSLGLAPNRSRVTLERIAVNVADARIADNDGARPVDRPVLRGGPDGVIAELPLRKMAETARAAGLRCDISNTAGTFVCNAVMYRLLLEARKSRIPAGFMHVPTLSRLLGRGRSRGEAVGRLCRGIRAAIETALRSPGAKRR